MKILARFLCALAILFAIPASADAQAIVQRIYNSGAAIQPGQLLTEDSANRVVPVTAGATGGVIGVSLSAAGGAGSPVSVEFLGWSPVNVDNTCVVGSVVVISPTINGLGHCQTPFATGQAIGMAEQNGSGLVNTLVSPTSATPVGPGSGTFVAGGDLGGSATSQVVNGLKGIVLPTLAASTGYLYDNNGALQLSAGAGLTDPGSNGVVKRTALNTTGVAAAADIIALWTGCTGSPTTVFLRADGSCQVPAGGGNVSNSGTPANAQVALWTGATTIQGVTLLPAANMPALTGDATSTSGTVATTVVQLRGIALPTLAAVSGTFIDTSGVLSLQSTPVTGTANQIDSTGGLNPTLSLDSALQFPGTANGKYISGVSYSASYAGATFDAQVASALSDAEGRSNGNTSGVVDSRNQSGTLSVVAQIAVGDGTNSTTWYTSANARVQANSFAGGTTAMVLQNSESSIVGSCGAPLSTGCIFQNNSGGGGLDYVYRTSGSGYFRASDLVFQNANASLAGGATCYIPGAADGSLWLRIECLNYVNSGGGYALEVGNAGSPCCSASIISSVMNNNWTGGPAEAIIGNASGDPNGFWHFAFSAGHPVAGDATIVVTDTSTAHNTITGWYGLYEEGSNSDTTTCANNWSGASSLFVIGGEIKGEVASSTEPVFCLSNTTATSVALVGISVPLNFTLPATIFQNNNSTWCPNTPCNVMSDAKGNLAAYFSNMMWADNATFFNHVDWETQTSTQITALGNPASGFYRLAMNSTTGLLACVTSGGASCMPTGSFTAGTDLSGTNTAQTVIGFEGTAISLGSLVTGQNWIYNGTNWVNSLPGVVPNAQTGTTYSILGDTSTSDRLKYLTFSNASPIAVTLAQAGSSGFGSNFAFVACDIGAGTATITPTTSTISYTTGTAYTSAASSMALTTGQCSFIYSNNSNWFAIQIAGGGGSGANAALSNLASVSINTALLAQTSIDLGSTTKPFRNLYLYGGSTYGTDYLEFTGTPTSTRTVTFPDASDTVVELAVAQALTNKSIVLTEINSGLTSGGVVCATSTTVIAMTAALTANVFPKGGGAGVCPSNSSVTDNGTTVTTTDTGGYVAPVFTANGSTAGYVSFPQGTDNSSGLPATAFTIEAPAAQTAARVQTPPGPPTNNFSAWLFSNATPSVGSFAKMPQTVMLTTQYTNSTTGFTNVTGTNSLAFNLEANTTYQGTCHLYYQAASTGGLNIEFTGPASPTFVTYSLYDPDIVTTTADVATTYSTSIGHAVTTASINLVATVTFGISNGSTSGTLQMLAKSSAAFQLQIQTGSYCVMQ